MSQLLLKPVKRHSFLRSLEIVPLIFSFLRNVQPNLLKLLNVQSFVFVLFTSLFTSTNAFAFHEKTTLFKGSYKSNTKPLNHYANTAPVALDDAKSVNEDSFVSGLVGVNDLDSDGDVLTFTVISTVNPSQGTLIFSANGSYTFLPAANFNGVVIAQYKVCDPSGLCDTATLTITVEPINDAPVASISIITTNEDVPKTGDLKPRILDIDNPSTTLTFTQIGMMAPIEGVYSLNLDGTYLYTPAPNYVGTTAVTYKVCDPLNLCDTSTLIISIIKVNDPPIAVNDSIVTLEDKPINNTVASNDTDSDNTASELTYTPISTLPASSGTLVLNPNGTYTFTPAPNFTGTVVVTYKVCDIGGLCDTATLTLTFTPVNDAPVATDTTVSTHEDTRLTSDLKPTVSDPDNPTNTLVFSQIGSIPITQGILTLYLDGAYIFTPAPNFTGTVVIIYKVCDQSGLCDTATLTIIVSPTNDKPTVTPLSISTLEDTPTTVCTTINDADLGETFIASPCGVNHGTATTTITGNQLCVTYSPSTNYNGLDTACFVVCDAGGLCDTIRIPIIVSPVNDKPTVSPVSISTVEDTPATVCTTISDADLGETFTARACGAEHGTARAAITGNQLCVTYTPHANYFGRDTACFIVCDANGGCDTVKIPVIISPINDKPFVTPLSILTLEDTPATICTTINDADVGETFTVTLCGVKNGTATATITANQLCVTYSPSRDYNGRDTICFIVCDLSNACDTLKIPIIISPVNDKPSVTPVNITTAENTPATVCTPINDVDLGETFTATLCGVKHGTATATIASNQLCVKYTPSNAYNGLDTVCFVVCDAGGACDTVKIPVVILAVNDSPLVTPTQISTLEDVTATVCTPINDVDLGETFTATLCSVNNGTTNATIIDNKLCVTYSPAANYNGRDTICYLVCDVGGACDTVKIPVTISPVNDKPIVTPTSILTIEDSTATVCTIIKDVDLGETFNATLCGVNHGTAAATITGNKLCVTYSPSANYNGLDTACFIVCDAVGACDTVKISITIKAVNDTPSLKITPVFILKDSTSQICFDIEDNDRNDTHTVILCGVQKGSAVITRVNKQVCVTYTSLKSYLGQDTVCMLVCDSAGLCKQVLIPVTVSDCNDQLAPILTCPAKIEISIMGTVIADPNFFIIQNSFSDNCDGLKLDFNKIAATDDCGIPTVSQISGLTKDSVFRVGRHFLTYQAKDLTGKTAQCQVEIAVSPIQLLEAHKMTICPNENLSLKAKTYSGANYKWTGPRNVSIDSILLTVPRTAGEAVEVFVVAAKFGACSFTDSITVTFRVQPTVNNDVFKISMNTELSNTVLSNDSTITPQKYTIKVTKSVTDGKLTFNADGTFLYKPAENYTGLDNFIYEVCPIDCPNTCEKATATIKVFNEKFLNKGVNVITPNSDGMNDALEIEDFDPDAPNNKSEIVIYNQWGNVVYSTTSYKNDWRGTFKDNSLPEGTYYFIFRKSPDAVPLKDFVTIIR